MKIFIIVMSVLILSIAIIYVVGALMPVKHQVSVSRLFAVDKKTLWQLLSDFGTQKDWRRDIVASNKVSESGAINEIWQETDRHGNAIRYENRDIIDEQTLKRVIVSENLAFGGYWMFELETANSQQQAMSKLTITEYGEVYHPLFRFIGKYVFGFDGTMKRYLQDLDAELQRRITFNYSAVK